MIVAEEFHELIGRVRGGDAEAAARLVREYEPEIRRSIRVRLRSSAMRKVLDSMDICQSVMANFFVRAGAGQFDIEEPGQLLRLLVTMARNKLLDLARHHNAARRDQRKVTGGSAAHLEVVAAVQETPSQIVAGRELIQEVRSRLSEEERYLAEQRANGRDWNELAAELSTTPGALCKKLSRAVDRVARELGLDEVDHA